MLSRSFRRGIIGLTLLAALTLAVPGWAGGPQKMNYQAMITDDYDQPLVHQSVTIEFSIWDSRNGGTLLWTETHNTTTNWIGVVSVVLGETNPIGVDFGTTRWLQIEVDGDVLSPRREIVGASYALYDETGSGGAGDGHSLDASDGYPTDALYIDADGDVGIGTTYPQAELHVYQEIQVGSTSVPGKLTVGGSSYPSVFDGGQPGNGSVVLPSGSICSTEMLDEPGVASANDGGGADLNGTVQSLAVRSLSAPSSGYLFAIATVQIALEHPGGGVSSTVRVGVTDIFPSWPANQDSYVKVAGDSPAGDYHHTVTVHGLFPMSAGQAKTINLYVRRISGSNGYYRNVQLTLAFFPTAYGTIEPMGAPAREDELETVIEGPNAGSDPTARASFENAGAVSDDETARLVRELMARVEELERQQENR